MPPTAAVKALKDRLLHLRLRDRSGGGARLAPGARIVETRIAQQFGVSQGPVREALRDLELFRFVVSSPFRGTQVRKISTQDLLEIYPIRAAREGVAARAAAARIDDATLTHLDELSEIMREAAAGGDHRTAVDADQAFHHTIGNEPNGIRRAGNGITTIRRYPLFWGCTAIPDP